MAGRGSKGDKEATEIRCKIFYARLEPERVPYPPRGWDEKEIFKARFDS